MRDRLTAKQEAFCLHYFTSRNASESAIKAGYSAEYPGTNCDDLLKNTKIQLRLAELQAQVAPSPEAINEAIAERTRLLMEVARHEIEVPVSAGHRVAAIREVNQMEHVYDEPAERGARVVNFVFVLPDGARLQPGEMVKQIEAKQEEKRDAVQ